VSEGFIADLTAYSLTADSTSRAEERPVRLFDVVVGSNQNLHAVAPEDAENAPASERRVGVQATLLSLLELAYGQRGAAHQALAQALADGGRDHLPDEPAEALAFVRAHLLGPLTTEVGPRLTVALVDEFVIRLGIASSAMSGPPPSMSRPVARVALKSRPVPQARSRDCVFVVDTDRVGRASLARALMRDRYGVTVVDTVEEARNALEDGDLPAVAIVDMLHDHAESILRAVVETFPDVAIVLRVAAAAAPPAAVDGVAEDRLTLCSRDASAEDLIEAVRRAWET
jgi:hypothetical protein